MLETIGLISCFKYAKINEEKTLKTLVGLGRYGLATRNKILLK